MDLRRTGRMGKWTLFLRRGGQLLASGATLLILGGCGGFIRSRFPDPNPSEQPHEGPAVVTETAPQVSLDLPLSPESPVEEPEFSLPAELGRHLDWGFFHADGTDSTRPSSEPGSRIGVFADQSPWVTLSEGVRSQTTGILLLKQAELEEPEQASGTPLYLAVDAQLAGHLITAAIYELEVRDHLNRPLIQRERKLARWDAESGRWFVPLSQLLGPRARQWVQPAHLFKVTWSFEIEHSKTVQVETLFRFRLPPPRIARISDRAFQGVWAPPVGDSQIQRRVIHEETWKNQSQREVELWLRTSSQGLSERHQIRQQTPELLRRNSPELNWKRKDLQTVTQFELGEVEVRGARRLGMNHSPTSESAWVRVLLSPGQEVHVQWLGRVLSSSFVEGCPLARERKVELTWFDERKSGCGRGAECDRVIQRKIQKSETWVPVEAQFFGSVKTEAFTVEPREVESGPFSGPDDGALLELEMAHREGETSWSRMPPAGLALPEWNCRDGQPSDGNRK